jgi:hypothetical protein
LGALFSLSFPLRKLPLARGGNGRREGFHPPCLLVNIMGGWVTPLPPVEGKSPVGERSFRGVWCRYVFFVKSAVGASYALG